MSEFLEYCRFHMKAFLWLGIVYLIFCLILFLYHIPLFVLSYAIVLSLAVGLMLLFLDFQAFHQKKERLKECRAMIDLSLNNLPTPTYELEEEYQELLRQMNQSRLQSINEKDKSMIEANDYYTMWAHQIKTPIQAMRLLLQSDSYDAEEIIHQLFRIEEYVNMVLQFQKSENLSSDMILEKVALDDCIKQAIRKYARYFIRKKIQLEYEETGTEIVTDEKWFVFILEQLLSNSLKYTMKGKVSIKVENQKLILTDTGIGIHAEDIPRLCEKGFTGYNGHQDKKSTGIGLYLCKKICDCLGYSLSFSSRINEGTQVTLDFSRDEE